jgi:hypothetical protein
MLAIRRNKVLLISAFVLALSFQACSSNTAIVNTPTNTLVVPTSTPPPTATPSKSYQIPFGSDAKVDNMKFVVTGAIRPADGLVSSGSMLNPQPGQYQHYVFVTLAVTCEAPSDQQCQVDKFKLKLSVSSGDLKYPKWFISIKDILQVKDIQGGTTISGQIPFIVSIGGSGLQLIYQSLSGDNFYFALP